LNKFDIAIKHASQRLLQHLLKQTRYVGGFGSHIWATVPEAFSQKIDKHRFKKPPPTGGIKVLGTIKYYQMVVMSVANTA